MGNLWQGGHQVKCKALHNNIIEHPRPHQATLGQCYNVIIAFTSYTIAHWTVHCGQWTLTFNQYI